MLIKLSNGVWVDPKAVNSIGGDNADPGGIFINLIGGMVYFNTPDDQQEAVDHIAGIVNKALVEQDLT